jgi:hypothetical protein
MNITEEPITEDEERFAELSCTDIAFAPRYIDDDGVALFESSTYTISKLLAEKGIETSRIVPGESEAEINENAFDLLLPVIIIGGSFLSSNPHLVSISLSLISSYIHDFFIGIRGEKTVKCKILIKGKKKTKKIYFEGPPEQFEQLKDLLTAADDD